MSTVESPVTIVVNRLALGPTVPGAGSPLLTRVGEVVARMGPAPWSKRIIADERNLVTLIASPPGGGNRPHWHREFDEWWVVLGGRLQWELTGGVVVNAAKDDIVWVPPTSPVLAGRLLVALEHSGFQVLDEFEPLVAADQRVDLVEAQDGDFNAGGCEPVQMKAFEGGLG